MSEEPTKDLSGQRTFEERVLAEFAGINTHLGAIEQRLTRVEQRLTTVEQKLTTVEQRLTTVEQKLTTVEQRLTTVEQKLSTFDERLTTLEDRVDARLRETRPIWEAVLSKIERLDQKFDTVIQDLYEVRTDIRQHDRRLTELERRSS